MTHDERAERRRKIAEAVASGKPVAQVAFEFGVSASTVRASCRERRTSTTRRSAVERRLKAGDSAADAAAATGTSIGYVYKVARDAGIKLPMVGRPSGNYEVLAALFDPTRSMAEIAEEHNVAKQRVQQIYARAKEAGIPVPARARTYSAIRDAIRAEMEARR